MIDHAMTRPLLIDKRAWDRLVYYAPVAAQLISYLNQPTGSRIRWIFVTYTSAFENAIRNVILNDGRPATAVFNDEINHHDHFHVRLK